MVAAFFDGIRTSDLKVTNGHRSSGAPLGNVRKLMKNSLQVHPARWANLVVHRLAAFVLLALSLFAMPNSAAAQTYNTAYVNYRVVLPASHFQVALYERWRSEPSRWFNTPQFSGGGTITYTGTWAWISRARWYQIRVRNLRTGEQRYGSWFYIFDTSPWVTAPTFYW
jgi:hypothetical protein